jgi:hypothetical protein
MSAEEEDRLDFGEDEDDRESEISLGLGGEDVDEAMQDVVEQAQQEGRHEEQAEEDATPSINSNNQSAAQFDEKQTEDGRPLPAGWIRKISSRGEAYFLNLETRKSTWDEPAEPARSTTPPPRSSAEKPASKREERKSTKDGNSASYASVVASNVAASDNRQISESREGQTVSDDKGTSAHLSTLDMARACLAKMDSTLIPICVARLSPDAVPSTVRALLRHRAVPSIWLP